MRKVALPMFKSLVQSSDGSLNKFDTIEIDKKLWIVPIWLDQPALKVTRPNRLIRIDSLRHQRVKTPDYEIVVNDPVPKALFEMTQPTPEQSSGFEIQELPDLFFEMPDGKHIDLQ